MDPNAWYPDSPAGTAYGYACLLDDQPGHACPERLVARLPTAIDDLVSAPGLTVCEAGEIGLGDALRPGPIAFADTPGYLKLPFWLGPGGLEALRAATDRDGLGALRPRWRALLAAAGLAVPREPTSTGADPEQPGRSPDYLPVGPVIHPYHLGALRLHTRRLLRTGAMTDGDGQSPLRWVRHNEPIASWIHRQLGPLVSQLAGTKLVPSYVYTAVSHHGADLPVHTDREQCDYTVSMYIDCLPEPPGDIPWPLVLDTARGRVVAYRGLGEGLLYRGCRIAHGRPRLPSGFVVTAMFFHFVEAGFSGPFE